MSVQMNFAASWRLSKFKAQITPDERSVVVDKDRLKGTAQQAKGAVKQVAGKATGDAKLQAESKSDKLSGKIQNAVGGLKDKLRGK